MQPELWAQCDHFGSGKELRSCVVVSWKQTADRAGIIAIELRQEEFLQLDAALRELRVGLLHEVGITLLDHTTVSRVLDSQMQRHRVTSSQRPQKIP